MRALLARQRHRCFAYFGHVVLVITHMCSVSVTTNRFSPQRHREHRVKMLFDLLSVFSVSPW